MTPDRNADCIDSKESEPITTMTEVGVSLALRRHRNLIGSSTKNLGTNTSSNSNSKTETSNSSSNISNNNNNNSITNEKRKRLRSPSPGFPALHGDSDGNSVNYGGATSTRTKRKPKPTTASTTIPPPSYSTWRIFFEGAALYVTCMILPDLVRVMVRIQQKIWRESGGVVVRIGGYVCSASWLVEYQICRRHHPDNNIDVDNDLHILSNANPSVLAPDAGISDLAIIVLLSLSMAVTRVALVHCLVPNYKQPKRLEALVRCKSIHLLSASYSGSVTPTKEKAMHGTTMRFNDSNKSAAKSLSGFYIADLNSSSNNGSDAETETAHDDIDVGPRFPSGPLSGLTHRAEGLELVPDNNTNENNDWLFHDDDDDYDYDDDHNDESHFQAPAVSSGLLTNSSAQNLQALLEQAAPSAQTIQNGFGNGGRGSKAEATGAATEQRIFAAPKYATAVFRLMYCLVSCSIGFCYFSAADFWPPAVGGTGNTKNCWDLSSIGVTLLNTDFDKIVDSDFDSYNPVLRRYYLIQASYHFHSAAFHILTSMLLWFVSKSSKKKESAPKFFGFIPTSMFTLYNVRIFFQHIFSLVLILGTYLFSSTRRLGAIAMISFDGSSLFLHLLQLGINAPQTTAAQKQHEHDASGKNNKHGAAAGGLSRKSMILILHRFLVVPTFCYARFYVFTFVVSYSALEESKDWLQQLENMLIPGTAVFIHGFFVVAMVLYVLMNLVYFWRLLNHPHVIDAMEKQERGGRANKYDNESEQH
uniref:TLC domain-containing protein n=1 Tax=Pseudo-nitzschia australis TaxID=44445 RepID=A0A7S4AFR4_9STRA